MAAESSPASMQIVSGNTQSAPANTELPRPVVVQVLNKSGLPVSNQMVNFRVTQGGGSGFAGAAVTNAQGIAQEQWTLGPTPGTPQALEARAVDSTTGEKLLFATFVATALDPASVVERVSVDPSSATVSVGATRQLTATARNAAGNALTGKSFTWSTSNSAVATVTSAGLVTARAAGTATITAATEGRSATSRLTITAVSGGTASVNECAAPRSGWIWCDDFEQNRLDRYFEYDNAGGAFVRATGSGRDGSVSMRARFAPGATNAGSLKLAFGRTPSSYFRPVDAGSANYRELYFRFYLRHAPNWQGGGGDKLARATVFAGSNWSQAMIAHLWSGSTGSAVNHILIEPASGTDTGGTLRTSRYNDFANLRWLGSRSSATPIFDGAHVGQWYCVESQVRLNDSGQNNGVFQLWIDGKSEAAISSLNWVGAYNAYGINSFLIENFWNAGAPQQQERFFDNLVVSTQRIGC